MRRSPYRLLTLVIMAASWVCLRAGDAAEWVYDDNLTLALETKDVQMAQGPVTRVVASAHLPLDTVQKWTDESAQRKLGGAPNPGFAESKGYRVRIRVRRNGEVMAPRRVRPGTGPLADWLGVYAAKMGKLIAWKRCAQMRVSFVHPLDGPQARYEIIWIVNCRKARTETLTLPAGPAAAPEAPPEGLSSVDGLGIYPPATQIGAPYPFTMTGGDEDSFREGAGLILASLKPSQAKQALELDATPQAWVLIGWQGDWGPCNSCFFSDADEAVALRPRLATPTEFPPGAHAEARGEPMSLGVRDNATGKVAAALSLAPGAEVARSAEGELFVLQGLVRVTSLTGHVDIACGTGSVRVKGFALLDVGPEKLTIWCVTRETEAGSERLEPGQVATWDGAGLRRRQFDVSELAEPFLRTCFAMPPTPVVVEAPAQEVPVRTGAIVHAVLCRGLDARSKPIRPGTQFPAGTGEITLLIEHRLPEGQRARIGVEFLKGDSARSRHRVDVGGSGKFVIEVRAKGARGFSPGKWLARIDVDGKLDREIGFVVGQ